MTSNRRALIVGAAIAGVVVAALIVGQMVLREPGTAPAASPSPSPTIVDVRTEVEQAYLAFWDEWTKANLELDASGLENVAAPPALTALRELVETQKANNEPVRIRVEHSYEITIKDATTASVDDRYVNHSQRLDGGSKEPIEADPNSPVRKSHTLRKMEGRWKVIEIIEYR